MTGDVKPDLFKPVINSISKFICVTIYSLVNYNIGLMIGQYYPLEIIEKGQVTEKIRLGKTNVMVTRVGFGGIPIQRPMEDEAVAIVKRCLKLGINYFDTANSYTTSEERIGKAIKNQRENVILATKSASRNHIELTNNLQFSLKRLGVDYIDLYQFHGVNDFKSLDVILEPGGPMSVVVEAKAKGLVKHIGITSHQIDVAKKAVATNQFETIMFPFNFIASEAKEELIPLCRKHDVGFIAMKPLAGGLVDNATIAIKYILQFPDIITIPGIEKITEVEEIIKITEGPLKMTQTEELEMSYIRETVGSHFCHRCDYCQPCSMDIPISAVMTGKSFYKRLPQERFFSTFFGTAIEKAANCCDCGECEKRCPYHLPIREMMKEQVAWYRDLIKNNKRLSS